MLVQMCASVLIMQRGEPVRSPGASRPVKTEPPARLEIRVSALRDPRASAVKKSKLVINFVKYFNSLFIVFFIVMGFYDQFAVMRCISL